MPPKNLFIFPEAYGENANTLTDFLKRYLDNSEEEEELLTTAIEDGVTETEFGMAMVYAIIAQHWCSEDDKWVRFGELFCYFIEHEPDQQPQFDLLRDCLQRNLPFLFDN